MEQDGGERRGAQLERVAQALRARAAVWAMVIAGLLVLYGVVAEHVIAGALGLLAAARLALLLRDALRREMRAGDWELLRGQLAERVAREDALGGTPAASPAAERAAAAVAAARQAYVPPRAPADIACEASGVITFLLLMPAAIVLHSRTFVFATPERGWLMPAAAALCVALYAWPTLWRGAASSPVRRLWWTLPALPALWLVYTGIVERHPYLDPRRADRAELAAARILTLRSNTVAGRYAGWVVDYARTLEERDPDRAVRLYRESLRLDPYHREARRRLAALEQAEPDAAPVAAADPGPLQPVPDADPQLPLLADGESAPGLPRCALDAGLAAVARTGVVLVPMGEVPEWLANAVGLVLGRELSLPVCLATPALMLPEPSRVRGLLIGDQWNVETLRTLFQEQAAAVPPSPVKYVVLTGADLYEPGTNFLFSRTYPWGAVVSFARFGAVDAPHVAVASRTAKAALGALLKSFGVPMSEDVACVTSYSRSLPEFDAKGNRPAAASFAHYRRALVARDRAWAARATSR